MVSPIQALVWGLGAVLTTEHADLGGVLIDLDPHADSAKLDLLYHELRLRDEHQVAHRDGLRYAVRLTPRAESALPPEQPYRLQLSPHGILDQLQRVQDVLPTPGAGEVVIKVRATSLNFRDVLNALAMYPGDAGPPGGECAGDVVARGEGVDQVDIGQAVVALAPGSFSSHVAVPVSMVVPKPEGLTFAAAASVPVAFSTAHYALNRVARLAAGAKVLIHAAAGGVGLAAVQLAQRVGAEIFATAGSPEKRDFLRSLGIEHVMDSRSLDFADEIRQLTAGLGVDVVLNSLAGDFIPKSLSVLAPSGHFLEIGKRGIWETERVEREYPEVDYHPILMDELMVESSQIVADLLREVMTDIAAGHLTPLRLRAFPMAEVVTAFRYMQQARHIGKIVLMHPRGPAASEMQADRTYLISGGLGALGREVCQHLVSRGARWVVLLGRRAPDADTLKMIQRLADAGARVMCRQVDVADASQVDQLQAELDRTFPPVRGVVHAAGVVDDGMLRQQSWDRFEHVLRPKVAGAWNLHQATRHQPLDFFVLFSSSAALLGTFGQGSYAAANRFLDALSHYRQRHGLVSLSINWGPWPVGMSALVGEAERQRWSALGMGEIALPEGLATLDQLLGDDRPQASVLPIDWSRFTTSSGAERHATLLAELAEHAAPRRAHAAPSPANHALRQQLESLPLAERYRNLRDHVSQQAIRMLRVGPSQSLAPQLSLLELGLDSLMAVELGNALSEMLGCPLPSTLVFDYPTVDQLTAYIARDVFKWTPAETSVEPTAPPPAIVSPEDRAAIETEVADLSEDELRHFIERELEKWGGRHEP